MLDKVLFQNAIIGISCSTACIIDLACMAANNDIAYSLILQLNRKLNSTIN